MCLDVNVYYNHIQNKKYLHFLSFLFFLSSGDASNMESNKMAQLAAICKIQLDQESV